MTFVPGIRNGKKQVPGSGINIPDHISESLGINFWVILKFFDADPDPGSFRPWIRDENIRIRDKHPGSVQYHVKDYLLCCAQTDLDKHCESATLHVRYHVKIYLLCCAQTRVGPYRRCFVYLHPSMPQEPVVVLHVALTEQATIMLLFVYLHPSMPQEPVVVLHMALTEQATIILLFVYLHPSMPQEPVVVLHVALTEQATTLIYFILYADPGSKPRPGPGF